MAEKLKPKALGQLFLEHYPVDENGYSKVALMDDLINICPDFKTHNGCTWARSHTSWLGKQFIIDRVKKSGRIYSIQLCGYNVERQSHSIPKEVRDNLKEDKCAVLDISTNLECDHKDGRYSQDYTSSDAFQMLNKTVNDAKRQHCKICKNTGSRFDAKILGSNISFYKGDKNSDFCEGCYWFDPKKFWQEVTIH